MSADNFNKKPDNPINKDEELTAILQRLSVLLDKSVSLDEAIELAKQHSTGDSTEKYDDAETKQDADKQEDTETEQTEDTVMPHEQDDLEAEIVTLLEEIDKEQEETPAEAEEPVEAQETIAVEAKDSDEEQREKSMPVSDFIKLLKSKHFTEQNEQDENSQSAIEDTQVSEETLTVEDTPVQEQDVPIEENSVAVESAPAEDKILDDENELVIEKKPLLDENTESQEITVEEEPVTSKIFDELLACFDDRKLPEDFRFSNTDSQEEEKTEVIEEQTNSDDVSDEVIEGEETSEEQTPEFVPIEYAPPEEDELFSKIFSEEKSERKNRERDKKKWQSQDGETSSFLSGLYDWLEVIVLSAAFALLLFTFILRLAIVDGDSMNHTLHDKELLIISDLMYTPENNDIIVFTSPNYPEPIVKRVIATAGQTVDIDFDTWTVTVDGKILEEDYINRVSGIMNSSDVAFPLTVPEGYIFVMGDNRNDSLDSRNSRIGFVDERFILGEVKLRIFPFDRFGPVD